MRGGWSPRGALGLWLRGAGYVLLVVVTVVAAVALLWPGLADPRPAAASAKSAEAILAYMSGFSTNRLEAKVGQPITLQLYSMDSSAHGDGGGKHQLAIDEFGVNMIAPPKGMTEFTFTPDKVGTFTFYCDICCGGKANPTMRGEFVVTA